MFFCSLLSYAQFSGTVSDSQGVKYTAKNDESTCYVSGHETNYNTTITIPEVYEGRAVTSIGYGAFEGCSGLTSVTIPNSVTSIGQEAFSGCSGITSVYISDVAAWCNISFYNSGSNPLYYAHHLFINNEEIKDLIIPNSVTSIGSSAFYNCSGLTSVTIPNSVTSIGYNAFHGCSGLTSVTIGNSVTSIGSGAFSGCSSLTSVTIPNSVTSIGKFAFNGCSGLTSVTIPNSVTSIGEFAFQGCSGLTSVHISDVAAWCKISFNGTLSNPLIYAHHLFINNEEIKDLIIPNSVTSIGDYAFDGCSGLTSVTIPNNVTSIRYYVFNGCSGLTSLTIPNSVTSIEGYTFAYCSGLTSLTIPNSVTSIGDGAFFCCRSLTSVTIPNSVTTIGQSAFSYCSGLTSVTIPNSVTSISHNPFGNCSGLTTIVVESGNPKYDSRNGCNAIIETTANTLVTGCMNTIIPNSVTNIGGQAFYGCSSLTSIQIPNSVTSIGFNAFTSCTGLTSIKIPNSVTSIGSGAFLGCSGLTSMTIPNSMTSIGGRVFEDCSCLTSLTIPNSVTSIGDGAFFGCRSLTSVIVENEIPLQIDYEVFYNSNYRNATLYVPVGCKAAYEAADYWKEFKEIIEMPASGDLNGDGIINGVDLVAQTNLILTDQYNATADLNNDGVVNGLDYVIMVNMILSYTSAPAMQAPASNRAASTVNMSIEDFDIKAGETKEMFINLSNPDTELTLLQFDMSLPEGLSIATEDGDYAIDIAGRTTWKRHSLMAKAIDGTTRFLLASNTNALIDGDNGNVISIKLTASNDFRSGDIKLENQLLVSPDAEDVMPADYIYSVGDATSIEGVMAGQPTDVYTLTGSKVRHAATSLDGLPMGVYIIKGKKVIVK